MLTLVRFSCGCVTIQMSVLLPSFARQTLDNQQHILFLDIPFHVAVRFCPSPFASSFSGPIDDFAKQAARPSSLKPRRRSPPSPRDPPRFTAVGTPTPAAGRAQRHLPAAVAAAALEAEADAVVVVWLAAWVGQLITLVLFRADTLFFSFHSCGPWSSYWTWRCPRRPRWLRQRKRRRQEDRQPFRRLAHDHCYDC